MYKIAQEKLPELYAALAQISTLLLPCKKNGAVNFAPYSAQADVALDVQLTNRSAKDVFFPQVENLLTFKTSGKDLALEQNVPPEGLTVVMGVRACDARSFSILDKVFLKAPVDTYYKTRRENCVLIGLGCTAPEETCFCHAFGIDAGAPETDVQTWLCGDALCWQPVTEKGTELTQKLLDAGVLLEADTDAEKAAIEQRKQTKKILSVLPLHDFKFDAELTQEELKVFHSKIWEELAQGCLSCCTCTYVCPTCHCYDIRDYKETEERTQRYRCWDSCMAKDFTLMAHGSPRKTKVERFRQRYMHKLVYFPENNEGAYACVGCGRCLAKCPVHLNIVKVAKELAKAEVKQDV